MFTHVDETNQPTMVDVSSKDITLRRALAESSVILTDEIMSHFKGNDISTKKGPVFQTAIVAGTMAAKKTADLIPLCHTLMLQSCKIDIKPKGDNRILIQCEVVTSGKTGVEMEALCGASISALTIYDMCKAFSHEIVVETTRLIEKQGGKNDFQRKK